MFSREDSSIINLFIIRGVDYVATTSQLTSPIVGAYF